jgi:integrase
VALASRRRRRSAQVLNREVAWGLLDFNLAKRGLPNLQRRPKEKRPFDSWAQIEAIAAQLGTVCGPMVIFGAATGLRPSELFGLEQRLAALRQQLEAAAGHP